MNASRRADYAQQQINDMKAGLFMPLTELIDQAAG